MSAICIGHIENAAIRSLVGNRCYTAAGLTINDSVGQTSTVTIAGTVQTGDIITVTINGTAIPFEITAGETTHDLVATAVAAAIEASAEAANVGATAALHVVTIVADPVGSAYTISVAVSGTTPTTTATLAHSTIGATGVETVNAIKLSVDGTMTAAAITTDIALAGPVLAASSYRWWLVVSDVAGTITTHRGVDNTAALPDIPSGTTPIGAVKVVTDSTHTFTPGTTGLGATGITTTCYDLSCVPKAGVPG